MSAELRALTPAAEAPEDPWPPLEQWARAVDAALRRRDVDAAAGAFEMFRRAARDTVRSVRRRARKYENALRDIAGSPVTDAQAARGLSALHGHGNERRRNPGGLSDLEQDLVERYRAVDPEARAALRVIVDRVAPRAGR